MSEPITNLCRANSDEGSVQGRIVGKNALAAHKSPDRFIMTGAIASLT